MVWLHCRRIRELNENNTKKFIEERKRQAVVQSRQIEATRKTHQEQLAKLTKALDWVRLEITRLPTSLGYNRKSTETFSTVNKK